MVAKCIFVNQSLVIIKHSSLLLNHGHRLAPYFFSTPRLRLRKIRLRTICDKMFAKSVLFFCTLLKRGKQIARSCPNGPKRFVQEFSRKPITSPSLKTVFNELNLLKCSEFALSVFLLYSPHFDMMQ